MGWERRRGKKEFIRVFCARWKIAVPGPIIRVYPFFSVGGLYAWHGMDWLGGLL
jgi:hypothetical protein